MGAAARPTPAQRLSANCHVCASLPAPRLIELNALLADPAEWPKNLLDGWDVPARAMPARMREWGGVELGIDILRQLGVKCTKAQMARHFTLHVAHVVKNPDEVGQVARMGTAPPPGSPADLAIRRAADDVSVQVVDTLPVIRPRMFVDYYAKGIQLGVFALETLQARIRKMQQEGKEVPDATLWKLADLGSKLAQHQASLVARGQRATEADDDEVGGFRDSAAPLPSERFGNLRIREVDGERRPIVDEGRADRIDYNERARQEGGPLLPV